MNNKKSLSGALNVLEALTNKQTIDDYIENSDNHKELLRNNSFVVEEINPSSIKRWQYKDRPEDELGDIDSLANELKTIGQQQPCIVRKISNNNFELIVGERRWLAAQKAQLKLKVIVEDIDDNTAALIQAAENDSRLDLSDYAKGMSLFKLINDKVITQKDLETKLSKSKQEITRLLSFAKIDNDVCESIQTFTKVSSRTAYEISRLSKKGYEYKEALKSISDKIRDGRYGANKVIDEVNKFVNKKDAKNTDSQKIYASDGRHLFTWRSDNNHKPSIHFPSDIVNLIVNNKINIDILSEGIKNEIYKQLKE